MSCNISKNQPGVSHKANVPLMGFSNNQQQQTKLQSNSMMNNQQIDSQANHSQNNIGSIGHIGQNSNLYNPHQQQSNY